MLIDLRVTLTLLIVDGIISLGQYFSKSCVPGILDDYYNPDGTNPVNLCEACGTQGPDRCMRTDEELYYGASGAFRCLTESRLSFLPTTLLGLI